MKVFLVTLVLGCAVLVLGPTVQSKLCNSNTSNPLKATEQGPVTLAGISLPPTVQAIPLAPADPPATPADPAALPAKPRKLEVNEALKLIQKSARKHKVRESFVRSIVAAESNFDSEAVSPAGAIGLMQVMPQTAQEFGCDPTIPEENIEAGTRYLRVLMDRYAGHRDPLKRVIAAYNAGPGNVDRYRGVPPFRETRTYVKRVMKNLRELEALPAKAPVTLADIMAD